MYQCTNCHAQSPKWVGKCPGCGEWNTLEEKEKAPTQKGKSIAGKIRTVDRLDTAVTATPLQPYVSTSSELDGVLGGGLTPGSLVLLSWEPGIGKSTLALQMCEWYAQEDREVLYISGEEHVWQVALRARRLSVQSEYISLLSEGRFDDILATIEMTPAKVVIIDSISVLSSERIEWTPGSISQIRAMTEMLMYTAKRSNISILLIGHVTKDGSISGPKSLEHLVDVVLFLEGVRTENYRILRAFKNRFGSTDAVGLFRMEESWLRDLPNPGTEFIDASTRKLPGSALTFTIEGNRPLLIEIEALTTYTKYGYPKRSARGIPAGKLDLLIAVMTKFTHTKLESYDVYLNIWHGIQAGEPGVDLACVAALMSARSGVALGDTLYLGEVSLTGIVKNVYHLEKRIMEAQKLWYTRIVIPEQYKGSIPHGMEVIQINRISELTLGWRLDLDDEE